jgi:UTP--glucose-1-phosphate uridylyltransferase
LGVVGRYILTPSIFRHLRDLRPGAGGELQLTDGIASLLTQEAVLAHRFEGVRYDCGSKIGYLQATVQFALRHPELKEEFATFLQNLPLKHIVQARQLATGSMPGKKVEAIAI